MVLELTWNARRILALRRNQAIIWRADDKVTMHLNNVRLHAQQVTSATYGEHDRYVRYFMNEILLLEAKLRAAAEQKDLVVSSDEFQSPEDIKGAFRQDVRERVFSYTWPIYSAGSVFTTTGWRYFFDLTMRMLAEGVLTQVRALLIVENRDLLNSPNVQRLLAFYSRATGADAKVVVISDFEEIAERNAIPKGWVDFGIYDKSLLYVTEHNNGRFTKDDSRISQYLRLFDTIWYSVGVVIASSQEMHDTPLLSLTELLETDRSASEMRP